MNRLPAFLLVAVLLLPTASAAGKLSYFKDRAAVPYVEGQYTDVCPGQWYTPAVAQAVTLGLMKGTSPTTFSPKGNVTLSMAVALCARIHAVYYTGTDTNFDQSQGTSWYDTYVTYAEQNGISAGLVLNDCDAPATRLEFAALLGNTLPREALEGINTVAEGDIPDVAAGSPFAAQIYTLYRAGVLTGIPEGHAFLPDANLTRSEAATIAARAASTDLRLTVVFSTPEEEQLNAVFRLVNEARVRNGSEPLAVNTVLNRAAAIRAKELAAKFAHNRPDGSTCFTVLDEVSFHYRAAGENIAYGYTSAAAVMEGWMHSESHRDNILSTQYCFAGFGLYIAADGTHYWSQLFADT